MAEATQFSISWPEVTTLLIKELQIHEGRWVAVIELAFTAGMIGQSQADSRPGAMILANGLRLSKADAGTPPHLVVDAAEVNPAVESATP